ncbi:hypothetical protein CEE37_01325 [candidate division LCP-89 bacterium B3_LCP]|uniref:PorV/PorQ family protein n=1 Tax=candidate division LCP-89 bacterium B3_LCP TaxID=2012998 RepID=A0A532V591_UNCL8|nr:MAG: hypothetical protein CEE37_01325 [candidate division LCP-89 bacterium B3_LCP]
MNLRISKATLVTALFSLLLIPFADANGTRYAGEFLEIGVGGRALGMGGAYCALADDPSSFYWNPAGLARVPSISIWGMYSNQFGELGDPLASYSVLGAVIPVTGAALGIHWVRLAVDQIPIFPDYSEDAGYSLEQRKQFINGIPTGYFGDSEDALFISFAKMIKFNLDLGWAFFVIPVEIPYGVNLKMVRQKLYDQEAFGIGADAGLQIKFALSDMFGKKYLGDFLIGMTYQDFSKTGIDWGEGNADVITQNFRFGIAYHQEIPKLNSEFNIERVSNTRYPYEGRFGMEYTWDKMLSLRFGFSRLDWGELTTGRWDDIDFGVWNAGAGIRFWHMTCDYAFLKAELGNAHRLSIIYQF